MLLTSGEPDDRATPPITLRAIDSHTGGEPTRLIVDGFPDLGGGSMAKRRDRFARDFDHWRQAAILEPRGNDVLVGALLCKTGLGGGYRWRDFLQQCRFF